MRPTRQHFKADDQVGITRMQPREHVLLPAVMCRRGMRLPQQDDARTRKPLEHLLHLQNLATGRVQPLRDVMLTTGLFFGRKWAIPNWDSNRQIIERQTLALISTWMA